MGFMFCIILSIPNSVVLFFMFYMADFTLAVMCVYEVLVLRLTKIAMSVVFGVIQMILGTLNL